MAEISETPLWVDGCLEAGNIRAGRVLIETTSGNLHSESQPNVWHATVNVPGMSGTGNVIAFATPHTVVPAGKNNNGSVRQVSVHSETSDSFVVCMHRSTTVNTWVFWFAVRNP